MKYDKHATTTSAICFLIAMIAVLVAAIGYLSHRVNRVEERLEHQESLMQESIETHRITSEILKELLRP